jgi:hypothetical protein
VTVCFHSHQPQLFIAAYPQKKKTVHCGQVYMIALIIKKRMRRLHGINSPSFRSLGSLIMRVMHGNQDKIINGASAARSAPFVLKTGRAT